MQAVDLMFQCSTFTNKQDNKPRFRGVEWPKFVEGMLKHKERADKDGPLWSPAVYKGTATRGNAGVESLTAAVADYDNGVPFVDVKDRLERYEYIVHSTHSHNLAHPKFRVIIPFFTPVPAKEWPDVKARIDEHVFGLANDPTAKDAARIYYTPSCPIGGPRFAEHHEGELLDPNSLPQSSSGNHKTAEPIQNRDSMGTLKVQLGKTALDFVANGAPLGEQRSRALAAARNYLSAGYSVEDTAAAIWRGFQESPQDPDRGPWEYEDALAIAKSLDEGEEPPFPYISPIAPRSEIRKLGLGYEAVFPAEGVNIVIDHLYRRSDGLRGEIDVKTVAPGAPRDLYRGNFILSTLAARTSMARHLGDRCKDSPLDKKKWEFILEDFCSKVVLAERQGEPLKRIGKQKLYNRTAWLVVDAILANDIGTLYGPGQTGKSRLALAWALSVLTGREFVPGFLPTEKGEIIYLDWETSEEKLVTRCQALCRGIGAEPVDFWYQPCAVPFVEMYEKTMKEVELNNIKLVVLDSVEAATAGTRDGGADQNSAVMLLYQALRHLKTSVLLIDHVSGAQANQTEGVRKPYGSIFKYNYARYAFELRNMQSRKQAGDEHLVLYCAKYNDGSMPKPVGIHVTYDGIKTAYEIEERPIRPVPGGPTHLEKVKEALNEGGLSYTATAVKSGLTEQQVRNVVSENQEQFIKDDSRKTVIIENNPFV